MCTYLTQTRRLAKLKDRLFNRSKKPKSSVIFSNVAMFLNPKYNVVITDIVSYFWLNLGLEGHVLVSLSQQSNRITL